MDGTDLNGEDRKLTKAFMCGWDEDTGKAITGLFVSTEISRHCQSFTEGYK